MRYCIIVPNSEELGTAVLAKANKLGEIIKSYHTDSEVIIESELRKSYNSSDKENDVSDKSSRLCNAINAIAKSDVVVIMEGYEYCRIAQLIFAIANYFGKKIEFHSYGDIRFSIRKSVNDNEKEKS